MRKGFGKNILFLCLIAFVVAGCSLLKRSQKSVSEKESSEMVSREQYNRLLAEYNKLIKERPENKKNLETMTVNNEDVGSKSESRKKHFANIDQVISGQINQMSGNASERKLESQTEKLLGIIDLMGHKKYGQAMKELQELENTEFKQIKVRSKYMIGEILFQQEEYDLAMQVYEEIVKEMAFSGYVLKAIQKLVLCTKELELDEKNKQYSSLLNELFGRMSL